MECIIARKFEARMRMCLAMKAYLSCLVAFALKVHGDTKLDLLLHYQLRSLDSWSPIFFTWLVSRLSALWNWGYGLGLLWSRLKHPRGFGSGMLNQEETSEELQYGQLLTRKGLSCVNWQWELGWCRAWVSASLSAADRDTNTAARRSLNRRAVVRVRSLTVGWSRNTSTAWSGRGWHGCPGHASLPPSMPWLHFHTVTYPGSTEDWSLSVGWKLVLESFRGFSNVGVLAERFVGQSVHITLCLDYSVSLSRLTGVEDDWIWDWSRMHFIWTGGHRDSFSWAILTLFQVPNWSK